MAKAGKVLSLSDLELQTLSKRANQRMLRLERLQAKEGTGHNQAYQTAQFMLEGRHRFKEKVDKLTEEQKAEQLYAVTAFLNNPLSLEKAEKQRIALKKELDAEIKRQIKEGLKPSKAKKAAEKVLKGKIKEGQLDTVIDYNAIEQTEILTSLADEAKPELDKRKEAQFWRIFNKAKAIFKNTTFEYRTYAKAITWRLQQGKATTRQIVRAMSNVVKNENLDRRMLYDAIGRA